MKKKLDERDEKAIQKGTKKLHGEMTCNDLILTNFHVIRDAVNEFEPHAGISTIKKEFAPGRSGRDILLATGDPSAIRKSCYHSCSMNHASSEKRNQ